MLVSLVFDHSSQSEVSQTIQDFICPLKITKLLSMKASFEFQIEVGWKNSFLDMIYQRIVSKKLPFHSMDNLSLFHET